MTPMDIFIRIVLIVVGFFATDRVLSRLLTGSWCNQPADLRSNDE